MDRLTEAIILKHEHTWTLVGGRAILDDDRRRDTRGYLGQQDTAR
jgi:hypothetical protein